MKKLIFFLMLLATACGASPTDQTVPATPLVIKVHATAAARFWQDALFVCAAQYPVVLVLSDPVSADISLRVGEPRNLASPAFQLGWEEIMVVVNTTRPSRQLNIDQVGALFSGRIKEWSEIDPGETGVVKVWVFAPGEDAQQVFAQSLKEGPIFSGARLAGSPEEMSQAVAADRNAVGILSRRWQTENTSTVYVAATVPVLAVTPSEPQGIAKDLLACLQG